MRATLALPGLLALCLSSACGTTKTGNPSAADDAPEGIELVRSGLARERKPELSAQDQSSFGADNREFSFALYAQLRDAGPNLFFSPYSVSTALAMTYAGARGSTKTEMASALRFRLGDETLHAAFNAVELSLERRKDELINDESDGNGFQLEVTNATFNQRGVRFVPEYLDLLARNYGSGLYLADFAANPERERMAINDWVLKRTMQRVRDLLPPGSIAADTPLVLVNAIYFKASWLEKFDPALTEMAPFHAASGDVTVPMMHGGGELFARRDDYEAVALAYISPAVRVLFILPDAGKLGAVEQRLDRALFDETRQALAGYHVDLRLPRFQFETPALKLKAALGALGMTQAFGPAADFSGIVPSGLFIDEVYHKAFVAMDEQGTEAAAATAVVTRPVSAPPRVEVTLDRPFIFIIYDEPTGQILFAGRLSEPNR